jgi:hypothetical protein
MKKSPRTVFEYLKNGLGPGSWRTFWHAKLREIPSSSKPAYIEGFFEKVEFDPVSGLCIPLNTIKQVDIPIGDLYLLPLGTVVNDGVRVRKGGELSQASRLATVKVNFNDEQLRHFLRFTELEFQDEERTLRSPFLLHSRHEIDIARYNAHLLAVGSRENPTAVLIPCSEIFRFFWARSSSLANVLTDSRFLDLDKYVFNAAKSKLSPDKSEALIWLRKWMRNVDTRFLSTILFDSVALERGKEIFRSIAGRADPKSNSNYSRAFRVLPPYQGEMELSAWIHPTRTGDKRETSIITQIISCDYISPIQTVKFDRDNDARKAKDGTRGDISLSIPAPPQTHYDDGEDEADNDEDDDTIDYWQSDAVPLEGSAIERTDELDDGNAFPNFENIQCEWLPQVTTDYFADQVLREQRWVEFLSTMDGSLASELVGPTLIVADELDTGEETPPDTQVTPVIGDLAKLATKLSALKGYVPTGGGSIECTNIEVYKYPFNAMRESFFSLPTSIFGKDIAWLYRDKKKLYRRRGICLRLDYFGKDDVFPPVRTRYLLDLEARELKEGDKKNNSVVVVWFQDEQPVAQEPKFFQRLIRRFALNRSTTPDISKLPQELQFMSLQHHPSDEMLTTEKWQEKLISYVFDAVTGVPRKRKKKSSVAALHG